jgi:malonate-semialdehyde dehydrogenase (acetylating)/methylmalonate-semialdehyde dehydrogenase
VVAVGDVYEPLLAALVTEAKKIVLGNGLEGGVTMGPVISGGALDRIATMIHIGIDEGATLVLDGRGASVPEYPEGQWLGPSIFTDVTDEMRLAREEVFGPVMVVRRAASLDEAVRLIHRSPHANAASIFTSSGGRARDFRYAAGASMIGVNVGVPAPMAFFPFGGTKESFFGDVKAHGKDAIRFFTDQKVVISRWF